MVNHRPAFEIAVDLFPDFTHLRDVVMQNFLPALSCPLGTHSSVERLASSIINSMAHPGLSCCPTQTVEAGRLGDTLLKSSNNLLDSPTGSRDHGGNPVTILWTPGEEILRYVASSAHPLDTGNTAEDRAHNEIWTVSSSGQSTEDNQQT